MLQDRLGFFLLDGLQCHVQNDMHDSCAKLEIAVQLHMLLCNHFGDAFTVVSFELSSKEVAQPALKKGNNTLLCRGTRWVSSKLDNRHSCSQGIGMTVEQMF